LFERSQFIYTLDNRHDAGLRTKIDPDH
jgi:hypothetical protein